MRSPRNRRATERRSCMNLFDREESFGRLPGISYFSYVRGHHTGEAISLTVRPCLRESDLTFTSYRRRLGREGTRKIRLNRQCIPTRRKRADRPVDSFDWPSRKAVMSGTSRSRPKARSRSTAAGSGAERSTGDRFPVFPVAGYLTHVAVAWSKAGGYTRIYINQQAGRGNGSVLRPGGDGIIYPWLAGYGGFVGALDEVKIYKVPLLPPFYQ